MNWYQETLGHGEHLGHEAAEHIARIADEYCAHERRFIELENEPRINELHVEGRELVGRKREWEELLRRTPRPGDGRNRRMRAAICAVIGLLLTFVAFWFSLLSFEPFRLGWTARLVCIGIALITPYAVHELLEAWNGEHLLKGIITIVFLAAVSGGALLAGIRADLLARQVQDISPAVVIDGENSATDQPHESFYEETRDAMRLLMVLLALAIDLGAGVAIHRAVELADNSGQDFRQIQAELDAVNEGLREIVAELTSRTNGPAQFEARFWRDFYRAMLTQSKKRAVSKILGISLCLILLSGARAFGAEKLNLVVALDLTASEGIKGHDGRSQFENNTAAVEKLLGSLPADSKVTVIGITDDSLGRPYILLSATISDDPGYFGERLASARRQVVLAWRKQASRIGATAKHTDILGALLLASELFRREGPEKRVLVLYSDMRNTTNDLNLELETAPNMQASLRTLDRQGLVPNLRGVVTFVLGADAAGVQVRRWNRVKQFWDSYFVETGAVLRCYSSLNELPKLEP